MQESDWKKFKKIKENALEAFCTKALKEFNEVIHNDSDTVYQRYQSLYQLVKNRDKQMTRMFDEHSRSKATLQLLAIRDKGLADEQLLSELSEEFLKSTNPKLFQ